ncbi:hypothetical protein QBC39DRAFT_436693 [Podospora conica]|nr:hypothetical protein QBC39DRAFT_436693 [Schizothecium conicum]
MSIPPMAKTRRGGAGTKMDQQPTPIADADLAYRLFIHCKDKAMAVSKLFDASNRGEYNTTLKIKFRDDTSRLVLWGYYSCKIDKGGLYGPFQQSRTFCSHVLENLGRLASILSYRMLPCLNLSVPEAAQSSHQLGVLLAECNEALSRLSYPSGESADHVGPENAIDALPDDLEEMIEDFSNEIYLLVNFVLPSRKTATAPQTIFTDLLTLQFPRAPATLVKLLGDTNYHRFLRAVHNRQGEGQHSQIRLAPWAETLISCVQGGNNAERMPQLPKSCPFECLCCGQRLHIQNKEAWRNHLFSDLRPWVCLDEGCKGMCFGTQRGWIAHLGNAHGYAPEWKSISCVLCHDNIPAGQSAIKRHLSAHLEAISLAALPSPADAVSSKER